MGLVGGCLPRAPRGLDVSAQREAFLTQRFENINTGPRHTGQPAAAAPHSTHTRCAGSVLTAARGDAGAESPWGSGGASGRTCAQVTSATECGCAVGLR